MDNKEDSEKKTSIWIWIVGIVIAWLIFGKGCQNDFEGSNKENEQQQFGVVSNEKKESSALGCSDGCTYHKEGCDIKGNISFDSKAKIYHLPGMEYYDETVINPDFGERWFCIESEAIENGWRKANSY